MTKLKIFLENNDRAVYFAGQLLKGMIELQLDEPKKVTGLYFIIKGHAKCSWTKSEYVWYRKNRKRVRYEGENIYFHLKTYLFGVRGGNNFQIEAGTHRYNFEYQLPPTIPSSFEGSKGYIRYNIEACLDIPWKFDKETKLQFTVVRHVDLNELPMLRMPCVSKGNDTTTCCIPKSDPLTVTVTIPCCGFTPGQTVPVTIHCDKKGDIRVTGVRFCLRRTIAYNSTYPRNNTKWKTEKMVEVSGKCVGEPTATATSNFVLPSMLVNSNNLYCNVVQVTYNLFVNVQVSGWHKNFEMVFPIVIGSVPIDLSQNYNDVATQQMQMPMQMPSQMPMQMPMPMPMPAPYTDYAMPSAPMPYSDTPPSFDDAVKMSPFNPSQSVSGYGAAAQPSSAPSAPLAQWESSAPSLEKKVDLSSLTNYD